MNVKYFAVVVTAGMLAAQVGVMSAPLPKKVLIIGVDGTRPDVMAQVPTPNINALKANGCFSDRAVTHPVTHSAACWSSMFCGVWGDKSLINDPGNALSPNNFEIYPSFFHRLERANSNLFTVGYARWSPIMSVWAPLVNFPAGADVRQAFGSDAALVTATRDMLSTNNPDVFFTILLDVDSAGHTAGGFQVTNPTYTNAIMTADTRIGQIMQALTNRVNYANEDWLVIVLSDHGAHDGTLQETRMTFHLLWGSAAARGTIWPTPSIVDMCATVLTHMGVPIQPAWNLDGRVEGLPLVPPAYGTNLIFNGDAEFNSGTNNYATNRGIAWWWDVSSLSLGVYGSAASFPTTSSPGPANRGKNFFLGGTASGSISQMIDLSTLGADIDDPGVDYQLSGWFGGAGTDNDNAVLGVRFLNRTNWQVGSNYVGSVTAANRGNVTGLLACSTNATMPVGTRLVEFVLTARAVTGMNDGSADNLSFVLTPRADAPFPIRARGFVGDNWEVEFASRTNRFYALERSPDFQAWTTASAESAGTGASLVLSDTNAPSGQAFYRVNCRRP